MSSVVTVVTVVWTLPTLPFNSGAPDGVIDFPFRISQYSTDRGAAIGMKCDADLSI